MALGKQAKALSRAQVEGALCYVATTRYPLRNRVILLLSVKAGLRAKEIASLTWDMVTNADGEVGDAIHLRDAASKGRSGRVIPLNRELRAALVELRSVEAARSPLPLHRHHRTLGDDQPPRYRGRLREVVSSARLRGVLQPQRAANLHNERGSKDIDSRGLAARRPGPRGALSAQHHPALHRG